MKEDRSQQIFRRVALERLSSPEQLDQLLQVTNPQGWLALIALLGVLLAALTWGVYGSIPSEALGDGILIRRGGVSDLVATVDGQVEEVLVAVGEAVAKDQPVATIRQEALLRQIADAKARRAAVDTELRELLRYADEQRRLSARNLAQQRANLELSIRTLERDLTILDERIAAEQSLLADGLITKQALLATEQQLNAARDKLAGQRLELDGLELKRLESEQLLLQQIETREGQLRELDLQLRELEASLAENVAVVSPHAGRVLELKVDRGDVVSPGSSILSMEVAGEELMAVLYVPAASGKKVQPGMEVRVSPSTVKREEYGFMIGEVTWVAEFPATSGGMMRLLANQELVTKLLAQGPLIQVDVALERDPATATGYRWSSSIGPDLDITSGTLASVSVILQTQRPLDLVFPKIRSQLGV